MPVESERWQIKDKAWLSSRRKQWGDIKERLVLSEKFTKKELKTYESYFIKGREPKWSKYPEQDWGWDDDPIPLLFRLWFDPDQSLGNWKRIYNELLSYVDSDVIEHSLEVSIEIFSVQANNHVTYSGLFSTPNGFMGGQEKKMFDFLIGPPNTEDVIRFLGTEVDKQLRFLCGYYSDMHEWLSTKNLHNSNKINQYKFEHWYYRLTDAYCEKINGNERDMERLVPYLATVAAYPEPDETSDDFIRQNYCAKAREILNNRPLPKLMSEWWDAAKATA